MIENVAYIQYIDNIQSEKVCVLRNTMSKIGFDFSLTGTKYIFELFIESMDNITCIIEYLLPNMSSLADRHNIKLKSLNRDIRWSIEKVGDDTKILIDPYDDFSTTKNILVWLYDIFAD